MIEPDGEVRKRVQELRDEIEALERERREINLAMSEAGRPLAPPPTGIGRFVPVFVGGPIVLVFAIVLIAHFEESDSETLYGRVRSASGAAPVAEGARCTVFLGSGDEDHDVQIAVLCNGRIVYGGDTSGWIDECNEREDLRWRCVDDHFTPDGGDPALIFDRGRRSVRIADSPPRWRLDIELTTPPAGVEAP